MYALMHADTSLHLARRLRHRKSTDRRTDHASGPKKRCLVGGINGARLSLCPDRITGECNTNNHLWDGGSRARATLWIPYYLLHSARAHADLGQFQEASRHIAEALATAEKAKEKWCEAELHRMAGEIALLSAEADQHKAATHFERALGIAQSKRQSPGNFGRPSARLGYG